MPTSRLPRLAITTLLLAGALVAGAWKMRALSRANTELFRQNVACTTAVREVGDSIRRAQAEALRRGSAARGFTLLSLAGAGLTLDPESEAGPLHLLFAEPRHPDFGRVLTEYRERFGGLAASRRLLVTVSGPEQVRARLGQAAAGFEVAVHGGEIFRVYGFLSGPGLAIVERGILRERWRLPHRDDQLPLD